MIWSMIECFFFGHRYDAYELTRVWINENYGWHDIVHEWKCDRCEKTIEGRLYNG